MLRNKQSYNHIAFYRIPAGKFCRNVDNCAPNKDDGKEAKRDTRNDNARPEIRQSAQYDNPEARRAIRFSKYCASYELLFSRDDLQKWEHEITRTAQFKAYTAYTKPHSYLDEFIPF